MAVAKKKQEPGLKDQLRADYNRREDRIEEASQDEHWELADWLAKYVPDGRETTPGSFITMEELAKEDRRSLRQLQRLRKVAIDTAGNRLEGVSTSTYTDLLQKHGGDIEKVNKALQKGKKRRDHRAGEGTKAIVKAILQKSQEDKEQVARAIYRDIGPVTIPNDDEEDIDDDDIDDEDSDPGPVHKSPSGSKTLRESYASCVTSTVEQHIDAVEGALKYLFETDMYVISKADRNRLRTILKKGLKNIDG